MTYDIRNLTRQFSDDDWLLLEKLNEVGAGTLTDLAVRLRTMPESVAPRLAEFHEAGLVDSQQIADGFENELYRVSDKGRLVLRLLSPA
jgi:DNA-binding MarR family transcriptional regulator